LWHSDCGNIQGATANEICNDSIINVTEEHINDVQKQQVAQAVDGFKAACLLSFSFVGRQGKVIQKGALPSPHPITITQDPMKFQELFDQAMHHTLINQSKVMTNSVQNAIYQMINSQLTPGYKGSAYSQLESSAAAATRATTSPAACIGFEPMADGAAQANTGFNPMPPTLFPPPVFPSMETQV